MAQGQHLAAHLGGVTHKPQEQVLPTSAAWLPGALSTPQLAAPAASAQANAHSGLFYAHKLVPSFNQTHKNTHPSQDICNKVHSKNNEVNLIACADLSGTKQDLRVLQSIFIYKWNKSPQSLEHYFYDFH